MFVAVNLIHLPGKLAGVKCATSVGDWARASATQQQKQKTMNNHNRVAKRFIRDALVVKHLLTEQQLACIHDRAI